MNPVTMTERMRAGEAMRKRVGRKLHGLWSPESADRDAVEVLEACSYGRVRKLVPFRYGRMLKSPFTFFRGSPALMARDFSRTPATGISVQASGDCHLLNFGLFGTAERNLVFDLNDFDETLKGPWEWDVKRLATSFVIAGRANGLSDDDCRAAAEMSVSSYREHIRGFAAMTPLEIWYSRIKAEDLIARAPDAESRARREKLAEKARKRAGEALLPKITEVVGGRHRFVEDPPLIRRMNRDAWSAPVLEGLERYRASLTDERRFLIDRYWLEDFALKVVGIGSVATRCYVALFFCDERSPLFLQVKEARRSVLEPYTEKSPYDNQGERVVVGQRLMQFAGDIFLGWFRGADDRDYYVRQLRDMKFSISIESLNSTQLKRYAEVCGLALARGHARSGDPAMIAGYLGSNEKFEIACATFAMAYADQTERDFERLHQANRSGRLAADLEAAR